LVACQKGIGGYWRVRHDAQPALTAVLRCRNVTSGPYVEDKAEVAVVKAIEAQEEARLLAEQAASTALSDVRTNFSSILTEWGKGVGEGSDMQRSLVRTESQLTTAHQNNNRYWRSQLNILTYCLQLFKFSKEEILEFPR
jgi:hypothetical protein